MTRYFPDWLGAYLDYTKHSEAPDQFHLWTGIGTIAGALRRRVWINKGYFKWHPNFFIVFVARPGVVSKSTTADIGIRLLRQVEGLRLGPSSATWQSLIQAMANNSEEVPLTPGPITPSTEFMPMSAMTVVAAELGTFLDPEDRKSIDALVSLWDCPDIFDKSTKMDGTETIVNAWFQLIGCTTPTWIAENMSNYFIGGGFASRTLFVHGEKKRRLVANPENLIPAGHSDMAAKLISDLGEISQLLGQYQIAPDAEAWMEEWYAEHHKESNPLWFHEASANYAARKQTHINKVAMVRAAAQRNSLIITKGDMLWALNQVTALEAHMAKVFGEMNREEIVRTQNSLLAELRNAPAHRMKKDELFRKFITNLGYTTFEEGLKSLYGAGLVRMETHGETTYLVLTEAA